SGIVADYLAGIYGAFGAMLALRALDLTGKGQVVDIGLYEPVFRILDELAPAYDTKGFVRERMGPGTVNVVPHSHYPTRDKRWIAIACTNDKIYERLSEAMTRSDMAPPPAWAKLANREQARADVDAHVGKWTSSLDKADILRICEECQVPCGPINSIAEIFADPQYAARENIARVADPRFEKPLAVGNVVPRLTDTPGGIDHLGPPLGADTTAIYEGLLGMSAERVEELRGKGVV
ncbi:MAG: CoA transferase, partial [Hyphomicrobium sp.]